jgi:hypothetical protein
MSTEPKHPLLLPALRYNEYSVAEFIKYCEPIRAELFKPGVEQVDREFLEKQFVNEMEPLAKMCGHLYGSPNQQVKVRHVNEQLADGIIVPEGATQNIFVEFTAAKDFYFLKYAFS